MNLCLSAYRIAQRIAAELQSKPISFCQASSHHVCITEFLKGRDGTKSWLCLTNGAIGWQMTETPLHRAAASNEVDAVKFLLEWQGAEKVELETKNTVRNSFVGLSHLLSLKLCLTNVGSSLSHILLQHEWVLQQICIAGFAE